MTGLSILSLPNSEDKNWKIESYGAAQGISKLTNSYRSDLATTNGKFLWGDRGMTILNIINDTTIPRTCIKGIDIFNEPQAFSNDPWAYINKEDTLWGLAKNIFYLSGKLPPSNSLFNQKKIKWDSVTSLYNMPVNLRLNYDENYLRFYFSQVNLGSIDTIWYRYILEGIDKSWSNRTSQAYTVNYQTLDPGTYILRVCSEGSNQVWSKPAELTFSISPPWWRTWWAYTIYAVCFGIVVWAFSIYRSRTLRKENRVLEEKIVARTHELQNRNEKVESTLKELRSTQAQLIQSEKMASLGELTAGIAHEIQNPLNFVNNFSEVNSELIDEMQQAIDKGNLLDAKAISNDIKDLSLIHI